LPRRSRYDLPGTVHHVCIRGIEGRRVFVDDADPVDLLRRYERWSLETKSRSLAWSINGNHAHFVIERGEEPLAVLMARFTSAFAQRFNWRHGRRGHLFMGRYESRRIRDDADLRWMVLYASANAVRHLAMTPTALEASAESSWAGMMGTRAARAFESFEQPLALYADDVEQARQSLRDALALAVAMKWTTPQEAQLAAVIEAECARQGIERADLARTTRRARAARHGVIRRAVEELGLRAIDVAPKIGVSRSQVLRVRRTWEPSR
jgi:REP element-mobilizing transposase RayT